MKAYQQTLSFLDTLKLRGLAHRLDEIIHDAEMDKTSYLTFLNTLLSADKTMGRFVCLIYLNFS